MAVGSILSSARGDRLPVIGLPRIEDSRIGDFMKYVLALDQGTTSSRAIVFGQDGAIKSIAQEEFTQHYPRPGWVEHDADEIWNSQLKVARQALAHGNLNPAEVAAIGITNQRETTLVWDRRTGQPIHHAIVWQDRRTSAECEKLSASGHGELVTSSTGLVIDPYFCATKLRWLLDHVPHAQRRAERGELAFGTIDSWLLWKLTGGALHVCDVTNASRTMLMNIQLLDWDPQMLELLRIPREILPQIVPSSMIYGETAPELFGQPIKLGGAAGDQQAALFGQNCTQPGMAKNTYGTGCFMLMNTGTKPKPSKSKLLTTTACSITGEAAFALEGSVFIAGAAVQWLRDGLGIIKSSAEVEALAGSVSSSDDLYMVPAFAGLGAPHWDANARGVLVGITRGTGPGHIARATLEGIAFQVADVLDAMRRDAEAEIAELRVDGGAAVNDMLMQFQADIIQAPVVRPKIVETTALGAAYLAGLAAGVWNDEQQLSSIWQTDRIFEPQMSEDEVQYRRGRWSDALTRAKKWEQES